MWVNENQAWWSQVHATAFRYLRVKSKKQGLSRQSMPILRGGGADFHPTPGQVTRKQTVNMTLAKDHHAQTRRTDINFLFFSHTSSMPINYTILFFWLGKTNIARTDTIPINRLFRACTTMIDRIKSAPVTHPSQSYCQMRNCQNMFFQTLYLKMTSKELEICSSNPKLLISIVWNPL